MEALSPIRDCRLEEICKKNYFLTISTESTFSKISQLISKSYKLNKIPK